MLPLCAIEKAAARQVGVERLDVAQALPAGGGIAHVARRPSRRAVRVPLAFINIAEAAAAALLMRRISIAFWPEETLEWIAGFYIGIGLIIPLVSGALATVVANLTIGASILESFTHWIIGHSLGLITCLPVFRFAYWRWSRGRNCLPNPEKWPFAAMILGGFAMLTIVVFTLDMRPLLVFPLLFVVVGSAMLEEALIAAMPVVLILIGGTFTLILSPFEWTIAKRYMLPGRGEAFIALVAGISLAAVMLGVAALVIVMSVMNGFRAELFDKIVGLNGHAIVQAYGGRLDNWQEVLKEVRATPGVTRASPLIEQPLLGSFNGRVEAVLCAAIRAGYPAA
jgi:hypothetical protein